MKLSIIIPVYNAENDIGRCVESIKTINEIDYECIIIDDGSTDNTWLKLKMPAVLHQCGRFISYRSFY